MADTVNIWEFRQATIAGIPMAPAFKVTRAWPIAQTFQTDESTVCVQITPAVDVRVTTDGSQAQQTDYLIHAGEIGTEVFRTADQYNINFLKAT